VPDTVAAHDHVAGAEGVDGVAVLAGAAGTGLDVFDTVVEHQRSIVADRGAQDLDAVVVRAQDRVARDDQAERVEGDNGRRGDVGEDVLRDVAGDLLEPDAVAAARNDIAIVDANVTSAEAMHEAAALRQRDAAAVERDAAKADAAGAFAEKH